MTSVAQRLRFGSADVLVADGFDGDVAAHRTRAATLAFTPVGPYYPGPRAAAPAAVVAAILRSADPLLRPVFGGDGRYAVSGAWYSIVTTPRATLTLPQRLPHYDGVEADALAIMLYLTPANLGGTAFYRHRATGLDAVTRADLGRYLDAVAREAAGRVPPPSYGDVDDPAYERLGAVAARPGRLIAYRGNVFHRALIADGAALSPDPRKGRLTLNIFARTGP